MRSSLSSAAEEEGGVGRCEAVRGCGVASKHREKQIIAQASNGRHTMRGTAGGERGTNWRYQSCQETFVKLWAVTYNKEPHRPPRPPPPAGKSFLGGSKATVLTYSPSAD